MGEEEADRERETAREMEESFKMRAEKLFGSHLFQSVPKSSFPTSSWSVTDGEVEKREWNRERGVDPDREDTPCSSAYYSEDGCLKKKNRRRRGKRLEVDDDDLDEEEEEEEEEERRNGDLEEERDIKDSIGMDSTLDREDEEDEFDMAAVCKEKTDDRVYMRDITDHGPYINYHSVVSDLPEHLSESVQRSNKDPRADHLAASIRLREDQAGDNIMYPDTDEGDMRMADSHTKVLTADLNLKPILKRKEKFVDPRPKKHVRFNSSYEDNQNTNSSEPTKDSLEVVKAMGTTSVITTGSITIPDNSPGIPDYLRNPSKYVCYNFDESAGINARSNQQAYANFQSMLRKSSPTELEAGSIELPKSLKFTPRKKTTDAMLTDNSELGAGDEYACKDPTSEIVRSNCIAIDAQESEACAMEEDDIVLSPVDEKEKTTPRRLQRKYRPKTTLDECAL